MWVCREKWWSISIFMPLKKLVLLVVMFDSPVSIFRKQGFLEAMNQFGLEICEDWIQYGDFHEESGYVAMKKILQIKKLPEAIFATSDMMALGALQAIKEAGLNCPEISG